MTLALDLTGKVALITGGSRGIGAACVRLFRQAGASVLFNYQKSSEAAQRLVIACGPERTIAVQSDLIGEGAEEMLVEEAVTRFGHLDILVVNHGVWPPHDRPIDELSDEQWRSTMAVNLDSAFLLVKSSVKVMKHARRGGHIVMVSSTAAQRGEAFHCDYAATKGAIISMVKGLSTELARRPHLCKLCRSRMGGDRYVRSGAGRAGGAAEDHQRDSAGPRRQARRNRRAHRVSVHSAGGLYHR